MNRHGRVGQDRFVRERKARWARLDALLSPGTALHRRPPLEISLLSSLYRAVSADLMRARASGYTRELVAHLDDLAARAHSTLYRAEPYDWRRVSALVARDFPRTLRANAPYLAAATALFLLPFVVGMVGTLIDPTFAFNVMPKLQLDVMVSMYEDGVDVGRTQGMNASMAGFYIQHNIGIAFQCFATGIFCGLGSVYFLVYNGVIFGTTLAYVGVAGHGRNILTFVLGHGAFELTAIVIAGAAGLRMGYALVRTEGMSRLASLRASATDVARMVLGAALMLAIAALIEGFWSPSPAPDPVKWTMAGGLWIGIILYIALAGRERVRGFAGREPLELGAGSLRGGLRP